MAVTIPPGYLLAILVEARPLASADDFVAGKRRNAKRRGIARSPPLLARQA